MNILICGSEGFLGCVLWRELKRAGHQVKGYDRGLYGIRNHDDDKFEKPDAVINLAALVGEPVCMSNPDLVEPYNVTFARDQALEAIKAKARTFVQISTCSVYGEQSASYTCTTATTVTDEGAPPYAGSKVRVERAMCGLDWGTTVPHVVRLGTLCGPGNHREDTLTNGRMRFDLMANGFCLSAARNRSVTIYNPDSVRPHVSTWAVAKALRHIVEHPTECSRFMNFPGHPYTVSDLAHIAATKFRPCRASVTCDKSKTVDDRRSYNVRCAPELEHITDRVEEAMTYVVKELWHYRWAGANPYSPDWGNNGWRWEA